MNFDKHKTLLSVVGGIFVLVIGYLIWRHEQTIQAANNASQQASDAAQEAQYVQQLEESSAYGASAGVPQVYGSTSAVEESPDTSGDVEGAGDSDSNIAAILSAFFPQGVTSGQPQSGPTTTGSTPTSGNGSSVTTSPVSPANPVTSVPPVATPQSPVAPINQATFGTGSAAPVGARPIATPRLPVSRAV